MIMCIEKHHALKIDLILCANITKSIFKTYKFKPIDWAQVVNLKLKFNHLNIILVYFLMEIIVDQILHISWLNSGFFLDKLES